MAKVAPDRLAQHNRMFLEDAVDAACSVPGVRVLVATHIGRLGIGSTRLHQDVESLWGGVGRCVGVPLRACERGLRYVLPNSKGLSPYAAMMLAVDA